MGESGAGTEPGAEAGAITALVDALRPLDAARVQLLRRAAHDLRTPLTAVAGFVELLADGALGPVTAEQERVLQAVARNTRSLMGLVDAFDPACAEPGAQRPHGAPHGDEGA